VRIINYGLPAEEFGLWLNRESRRVPRLCEPCDSSRQILNAVRGNFMSIMGESIASTSDFAFPETRHGSQSRGTRKY
jgi:hypothetical protein